MVTHQLGDTMLKAILEKFNLIGKGKTSSEEGSSTPDISRVVKMPTPDIKTDAPDIDPDTLGDRAEAAVDDLSDQFDAWMEKDLSRLTAAWDIAQNDGASVADLNALETCAHNIRGVATSYGYPAISRLCGSLCALLAETSPGESTALINLHVEACKAAYASIRQGGAQDHVADAVCDALEHRVAARTANL